MEKTRKKHLKALVILCLIANMGYAQAKGGMENYNFLRQGQAYTWMPVMHYQTQKGLYAELRYNYEELNTLSLFGGKTINIGSKKTISLTPMIGFSTGDFSGASFAVNTEFELNDLFLSVETQYSRSFNKNMPDFLFNWSELGYTISENLFAGLSVQYTRQQGLVTMEPGLMAGLSFGHISVPFYVFNPFNKHQYIVLGLNYEYNLKN